MTCSSCGADNRPGGKFCVECGAALSSACPRCGTSVPPAAKFCGECGERLTLTSAGGDPAVTRTVGPRQPDSTDRDPATGGPLPVGAERRIVTVLFADLVGFTSLAEGRDAERVRDLLSRYFETASEIVARYGGTIEKFIGDAVMAVWGAPTAHEDDAERAVPRRRSSPTSSCGTRSGAGTRPARSGTGCSSPRRTTSMPRSPTSGSGSRRRWLATP